MPAVIFGQNGAQGGPVRSKGPEVVAQNRNRSKFRKTSIFKALRAVELAWKYVEL